MNQIYHKPCHSFNQSIIHQSVLPSIQKIFTKFLLWVTHFIRCSGISSHFMPMLLGLQIPCLENKPSFQELKPGNHNLETVMDPHKTVYTVLLTTPFLLSLFLGTIVHPSYFSPTLLSCAL